MTKFVFVTGGVVSSLGKGIASASLAAILESRGLKVTLIKLDPYINVDPGTMSPFQHGEVFVTDDGAETDLDLGHYERFIAASNVLNQKIGFCFYGLKPRQTPFQGGFMCIVAPTKRTPNQSSNGAAPPASDCSGAFTFDFNARIQSGVDPQLVAGQEVFAQYWSRDPQDASTTNLTDALALFITP